MTETIRILIADDHPIVREGLRSLIAIQPDMQMVGEAVDGVEAVLKTRSLRPDVVLIDLVMPRKSGIDAIKEIKAEYPDIPILVLTSFAEDEQVFPAIEAGALGYILKDTAPQKVLEAIRDVYQGESFLNSTVALKLMHQFRRPSEQTAIEELLTDREIEVLKLVSRGLSNQVIGDKLSINERTVGSHVSNILQKLQLENRTQAALYALRIGLVTLDD